ncbi:MFS transporter [Ethanoligenens harbinense]|uniref:Major facilitator superfamily MFS_1 n=1 Tax=Ethanoligenens harbinense (strain DSM 18485 / JCM 12961 / CGMCC 1.5033 / YUAN-3) TaxID=663278 RepID=E6U6T5_ETHHY|nr:MFS transporter [Ethanoligenens harbinense]ADU26902.1 major facilitator superfamily MFS_1 [Ethanoligenens harbinense YUAN-3]AVQ95998.1 MFS transporter [Ethanoligenens harbinense YUAN-3]AYF38660.1 MFS transporter [Ethanoligenens harbinense]AYF41407.1 MFS transporter [Ethanoligenens harbinense]QCN92241.1 MFS transporter [Ethanoligenens harbinense]
MQDKSTHHVPPPYNHSLALFLLTVVTSGFAGQMIAVSIGWQMYALTKSTFYLGLVGLMQFLPMILMTLFSGYIADHFNRKLIVFFCNAGLCLCFLFLGISSYLGVIRTSSLLVSAFIIGAVLSLYGPSMQSLLPGIVEQAAFTKATARNAACFQAATIVGPALGGLLYAFGADIVYFASAISIAVGCISILFVRVKTREIKHEPIGAQTLLAGVTFIKSRPVILGAISLDLFAVLFGGATALLPVYASTILKIGAVGLGILRSAPAIGAFLVSFFLARRPIGRRVGVTMFMAVIVFGLATICFAVSRSFALSLAALLVLGTADVISVVIRSSLVQLQTPDAMRGRVSSVNQLFIGTSNQLGEFESGLTASIFGTVSAALIGGIGTICVVLIWMKLFPRLRRMDTYEYSTEPRPQTIA